MARQRGLIKLEGTMAEITFYRSGGKYRAKEKQIISPERLATDPAFARMRENGTEFGRAGKAGKAVRNAFQTMLKRLADDLMVSRLQKRMMKVLQSDLDTPRGLRTVQDGDLQLLKGFDFNINGPLSAVMQAPYTVTADPVTGEIEVVIPAFVPDMLLSPGSGATHYQFLMGGAEINFANGDFKSGKEASTILPINMVDSAPLTLGVTLTPGTALPIFVVLGIRYYQEVNGMQYPLFDSSAQSIAIVNVTV